MAKKQQQESRLGNVSEPIRPIDQTVEPVSGVVFTVAEVLRRRALELRSKHSPAVTAAIDQFNSMALSNVNVIEVSFTGLTVDELGQLRDRIAEAGYKVGVRTDDKMVVATIPKY